MKIFETVEAYREWRHSLAPELTVGFVPTMGALHNGHAKLLRESVKANDFTVLSIFVNPTQFNQKSDFDHYPVTLDQDLALAVKTGVDAVFLPARPEILYPRGYRVVIREEDFATRLCGAHRPGHFNGVLSVVMKLFQIVKPTRAYFGEKDYQQLVLIQRMVEDYFLELEIVPVETEYEASGLAMSSRNKRLTPEQLELAPALHRAMIEDASTEAVTEKLTQQGFKVEYVEDVEMGGRKRRFAAAWLGEVRLIDNVPL